MNYSNPDLHKLLIDSLSKLNNWRSNANAHRPTPSVPNVSAQQVSDVISRLLERLEGNYPFHDACYAGQMLKPPHPAAWLAYLLTSTINPNNHALDGGPPTSEMENESVEKLASMMGFGPDFLGHLTGGGTMANLEALWVAKKLHPNQAVAFSSQAHYTHKRMCELLDMPTITIPTDLKGQWNIELLRSRLPEMGTLVVTLGTTGLGQVEPLHELISEAKKHDVRIHVDAAYGGYFKLLENNETLDSAPWEAISKADSLVIDPHKHGLQPYGCGCVLFNDAGVGRFYLHDSPYTYFTSDELHLGEISLECSRPGAAAAALWATLELFPLEEENGMGPVLAECRTAALHLYEMLLENSLYNPLIKPGLDIVGYYPKVHDETYSTSRISAYSKQIFEEGMRNRKKPLYLSLYKISSEQLHTIDPDIKVDTDQTTILRSVLMKPEHNSFIPELVKRLIQYHPET